MARLVGWDRVRSGLCGDDPEARDASIARVADWRRRGRVPHAVDCTASLLETRALDAGVPGNVTGASPRLSAPLSENMLRLAYAAALVRMVNGAVDPSQKGKYAAPVMTLAKRMGIPAVLVDVRMAASHQEMPALALLRHASERALQWLFERYWHAQANQLRELRRGAALAAEDLVAAEAARRVKAERNVSFRKAERGKEKPRPARGTGVCTWKTNPTRIPNPTTTTTASGGGEERRTKDSREGRRPRRDARAAPERDEPSVRGGVARGHGDVRGGASRPSRWGCAVPSTERPMVRTPRTPLWGLARDRGAAAETVARRWTRRCF